MIQSLAKAALEHILKSPSLAEITAPLENLKVCLGDSLHSSFAVALGFPQEKCLSAEKLTAMVEIEVAEKVHSVLSVAINSSVWPSEPALSVSGSMSNAKTLKPCKETCSGKSSTGESAVSMDASSFSTEEMTKNLISLLIRKLFLPVPYLIHETQEKVITDSIIQRLCVKWQDKNIIPISAVSKIKDEEQLRKIIKGTIKDMIRSQGHNRYVRFSVRQFIGFTLTLLTLQATPTNGHAPYFLQPSCEHALFTRSLLSHWLEPRTHLIVIGQVLPPAIHGSFWVLCKEKEHDSEQSVLEYTDLEAAEALVCMSSWGQSHFLGSSRPNPCKPRPLTPASDSCDSLMPPELPEPPKDFVSLSSLCMTPPHSPSFVETSSPAVSSQHCSGLHQPVLAPIAEKTPSLPLSHSPAEPWRRASSATQQTAPPANTTFQWPPIQRKQDTQ
ncbi:hypothetical protein F7725_008068 [Dissostichus mawsoni]|uniref:Uncharacterized protein n=1 Tax=Dissostichus mawsoni TaxID=36200 RepID=A0A7J5Y646_DISMA|nr:hypothetical protein F7725_008068 [Dissostichus mawsoni]